MKLLIIISAFSFIVLTSCKEKLVQPNVLEQETITALELTLIANQLPRDTIVVVWSDADGIGGEMPSRIDTLKIDSSKTYYVSVRVLNEKVFPAEDLTSTILANEGYHQFFYTFVPASICTVQILDQDDRRLPVGLKFDISPRTSGVGKFTASMAHFDFFTDKDGVNPGSKTDISVEFPVMIRRN